MEVKETEVKIVEQKKDEDIKMEDKKPPKKPSFGIKIKGVWILNYKKIRHGARGVDKLLSDTIGERWEKFFPDVGDFNAVTTCFRSKTASF